MFTVKATYRNETRRFTFPNFVLFPTYDELCHQLYRVFPASRNCYLSRLIFSPDASKVGRILVGREVHSAEDYDSCVAPLRRQWPNPLLRLTVFDEASEVASEKLPPCGASAIPLSVAAPWLPSPVVPSRNCVPPLNPQPFIPPPPPPPPQQSATCIFPPLSSPPSPPPTVFSPTPGRSYSPRECRTVRSVSCCPISKGKADVELLLSSFKEDLESILRRMLGVPGVNFISPQAEAPVSADADTSSRWCFVCKTSFSGVWYGCDKCPWHAVCPSCFSKSHSAHTHSFGPSHVVRQRSTNCFPKASAQTTKETQSRDGILGSPVLLGASSVPAREPVPSVHFGVICDSCNRTVMGVRHKCLDCPDYDLCTACVESGATEKHNPFHEFLDIETPRCIYTRTVPSGDEDGSLGNPQGSSTQGSAVAATGPLVRHSATCDLCDSAIVGGRYKCVVCPDFDTCSSCFRITTEQHPSHGFVKVNNPEDLMMRDSLTIRRATHFATCDSCRKTIRGARYKCMHPNCPDFDLCSDCEALPIPVHPLNHPMLKLRTSDTVIPAVYRVGQTRTMDESTSQKSALVCDVSGPPAWHSTSPHAAPVEPPELRPADVSEQAISVTAKDQILSTEEFLGPLDSASDVLRVVPSTVTIAPSHLLVDVTDPAVSPRLIQPELEVYHHLWPKVNQEMMHLNATQVLGDGDSVDPVAGALAEGVGHKPFVAEGSLPGTPLPPSSEHHGPCPVSPIPSTESIFDGHPTPSSILSSVQESQCASRQFLTDDQRATIAVPRQGCLDAALVADANVPVGQIFPPGAEFVKGWHMINDGGLPWPTSTEIRFVAGEMFASESSAALRAKVGVVQPGQDLDIWTGDLKAPDTPGRYVGYWRLNDGLGNFFGNSVWIDLTVADHCVDQTSEHSLAASSMVMPSAHHINSVDASDELQDAPKPRPSLSSTKTMTDEVEDLESDNYSVFLVSVPTSDDEDTEWQDTRTHSEPLEYVVLYDSNPED